MKKQLFILTALFILTTGMAGCEGEEKGKETLIGSKWRLTAFVNGETGSIVEPEPKDCEKCYTFTFDTDSTASGYSIANIILVTLSSHPSIGVATEIYDENIGNATIFYDAIKTIDSYKFENKELKFYYDDGKKYLLFKQSGL